MLENRYWKELNKANSAGSEETWASEDILFPMGGINATFRSCFAFHQPIVEGVVSVSRMAVPVSYCRCDLSN